MKLTFSSRIFVGYFLIMAIATWFLFNNLVDQIKPVMRQAVEYSLVDNANLLAELLKPQVQRGEIEESTIEAVSFAKNRRLDVDIWGLDKLELALDFYVTDQAGWVLFDSKGNHTGKDFSQWRDVFLTLKGKYGARSTLSDKNDPLSSVMHVAAPVLDDGEIIGVVTVYTPNLSLQPYLDGSRSKVIEQGLLLLVITTLIGGVLSFWLSHSVTKLVKYANAVRQGKRVSLPKLKGTELNQLAHAIDNMRVQLEGKAYVENYVQALTHELKSPVAAIKGAAELINKDTPDHIRDQFIANISEQSLRIERTVEQMLRLSVLENSKELAQQSAVTLGTLIQHSIRSKSGKAELKNLSIDFEYDEFQKADIVGDHDLLLLALDNLLDNAIDFSLSDQRIELQLVKTEHAYTITMIDQAGGIPEYALDKVFQRFYSLPRPDGKSKSTGLGLSFVKEIIELHNGDMTLSNFNKGLKIELILPV
jgi:two-component system, OmpR family, sensor histidine kinase CreC